jgi:teichuronic acid biosynthesis glycosyltransferase TuaC
MRSLEVSQDYPDEFYPNRGMFVKQAMDAVHRAGVEIEVVSPRAHVIPIKGFPNYLFSQVPLTETERELGYTIHHPRYFYPVPKRFLYRFAGPNYARSVGNYILKNVKKTDIIHAHFSYPDGYGMLRLRKEWKVPMVAHLRGGFIWSTGAAYPPIKDKHLEVLNTVDRLIAVSHDTKNEYVELGIPGEKIEVIPNGVDMKKFRIIDQNEARAELDLPQDRQIILFAGYLRPRKGLQYLIEAIPKLVKDHSDGNDGPLFLILGEGEQRAELERKIAEYHLENNVRLMGLQPHDRMPYFVNAMDCLVLPTQKEGRPNVVIEAMAVEKPVVASAVSGIPELMIDNQTGYLIPPRDIQEIEVALGKILADPEKAKKMGRAGRDRILKMDLTWENKAKRTIAVYEDLVNGS